VHHRVVISGKGVQPWAVDVVEPIVTIGSEGTIQLPDPTVGKQALILRKHAAGRYMAEPGDGWVQRNGLRFMKAAAIRANDDFRIGPFRVVVHQYREVPAGKPVQPALPSLKHDALVTDAQARMSWGADAAVVEKDLVSGGLSPQEAKAAVKRMDRHERIRTRVIGIGQVVLGGLLGGLGVAAVAYSRSGSRAIMLAVIGFAIFGHGLYRLAFGDRERYEIG
jgi:hypothetical protein